MLKTTSALYVHIPFCDSICSYCDFCKVFYNEKMVDDYLTALEKEAQTLQGTMTTIYIGGGTPSSLSLAQLARLMHILAPFCDAHTLEYTMEANPESVTLEKLQLLAHYGVNRLSLGVQSFQPHLIKAIERHHHQQMVIDVLKMAQDYIPSLSIDMMYGLPGQTLADLKKDLAVIDTLPITHLSYYDLILEAGTKLSHTSYQGIDEDLDDAMETQIHHHLELLGYHQYEVSNYALGNHESMHNKVYWHYDNYYGIGAGASSKIDDCMIDHSRALLKYLHGEDITHVTKLSKEDTMFNHLMMSLRLVEGLDLTEFTRRYGKRVQEVYQEPLKKHLSLGNLVIDDNHLKTTPKSLRYLNSILVDFLD